MGAHVFEVCVSHVVDAEDVDVGVEGDAFLDVGVEAESQFFAFFLRFGDVDDFCAFGFRHFGRWFGRIEYVYGVGCEGNIAASTF